MCAFFFLNPTSILTAMETESRTQIRVCVSGGLCEISELEGKSVCVCLFSRLLRSRLFHSAIQGTLQNTLECEELIRTLDIIGSLNDQNIITRWNFHGSDADIDAGTNAFFLPLYDLGRFPSAVHLPSDLHQQEIALHLKLQWFLSATLIRSHNPHSLHVHMQRCTHQENLSPVKLQKV